MELVQLNTVRKEFISEDLYRPVAHCGVYKAKVLLLLDTPSDKTPAVLIGHIFEEHHCNCNAFLGIVAVRMSEESVKMVDESLRSFTTGKSFVQSVQYLFGAITNNHRLAHPHLEDIAKAVQETWRTRFASREGRFVPCLHLSDITPWASDLIFSYRHAQRTIDLVIDAGKALDPAVVYVDLSAYID